MDIFPWKGGQIMINYGMMMNYESKLGTSPHLSNIIDYILYVKDSHGALELHKKQDSVMFYIYMYICV